MREIELSRGLVATVDDEDFEFLSQWKWSAMKVVKAKTVRFYAVRSEKRGGKQTMYLMHRALSGAPKGMVVDHRDNDGLNNRKANLRVCTQSQNMMNSRGHGDRSSAFKGVSRHTQNGNWCAQFRSQKLGVFDHEEIAAMACNVAAAAFDPHHALLNEVEMG